MGKTAFIFPGQGAQYVGMGKDFYEQYPCAREVFDEASQVSGLDMEQLIFEKNEQLNITKYTQVAMLTVELAILRVLKEKNIAADVTAGLSLGEYAAIVAAAGLSERDALSLVVKRGRFMQEAVPTGGAMMAILGCSQKVIEQVCEDTTGVVSIANYNCPGQIVITGEQRAVELAGAKLKEAGAKRCLPLNVSGPFHSALLQEAGKKLALELEQVEVDTPMIPYVSNTTAEYVKSAEEIRPLLERQISSSVRWQQSVERMIADGVDLFIEIGPKKTLCGFLRKIAPEVRAVNIETVADLEQLQ